MIFEAEKFTIRKWNKLSLVLKCLLFFKLCHSNVVFNSNNCFSFIVASEGDQK